MNNKFCYKKIMLVMAFGMIAFVTCAQEAPVALPPSSEVETSISPAPEKSGDQKTFAHKHKGKIIAAILATSAVLGGGAVFLVLNNLYQSKKWLNNNFLLTLTDDDAASWSKALDAAMRRENNNILLRSQIYSEVRYALGLSTNTSRVYTAIGSTVDNLPVANNELIKINDNISFAMAKKVRINFNGGRGIIFALDSSNDIYIKSSNTDQWFFVRPDPLNSKS